jgi:choline transport protein
MSDHSVDDSRKHGKELQNTMSMEHGQVAEQQRKKPFTILSALSLGYSISNAGTGMLLVVGNAAFGAGPLFFWGTILVAAVSFCVAVSLGELASAYPHAGGQYYWVAKLAPERSRRFMSYMTAIVSWASVICICSSSCAAVSNVTFQLVSLVHPDFQYRQWMGFLVFEAANFFAVFLNLFEKTLPALMRLFLLYSVSIAVIFFICLLAPGSEKQSAAEVFGAGEYFNQSGWPNGLAFFIGISGVNWGFSCLDAATHIAEEIPKPRENIPRALFATVFVSLVVSVLLNLAIFFVAVDLESTTSIISVLSTVYNGNTAPALGLGTLLIVSAWTSTVGIHTWQARIAWSLARDNGFPFSHYMSQLAPAPFHTPIWAELWCTLWVGLCGFLYLGSETAFNSFIAAGIVLQYVTYAMAAMCLLISGRKNLPHGPFWWPRLGLVSNIVLILWTALTLVIYSFPYYLPVEADSMNYVSVVIVIVFIYALAYWALYGYKRYRLPSSQTHIE